MILDVAVLNVKSTMETEFEKAFAEAREIISGSDGYISHELKKCIEAPARYLLLVKWETLENHTVGFRQTDQYKQWSALLHQKFYWIKKSLQKESMNT